MMKNLTLFTAALLLTAFVGCSNKPSETTADTSNSTNTTTSDSEPLNSEDVEASDGEDTIAAEIKSWEEVESWVAEQKGKVVVVDIWSNFCEECVKEFPHFVELHDRLGDRIVCVSLNLDYYGAEDDTLEDIKPRVIEFLTEKNATSTNFVSSTTDEKVMEALKVASIPAALVYDQTGSLKKTFSNDEGEYGDDGFNYADHIGPLVEELLTADK